MFQRIQQYPLITAGARIYRPRAYGDPRPDGMWDGWLVFFPLDGGRAIATDRETTQTSFETLVHWASTVGEVYLVGALDRALQIDQQPPVLADLARAEYEALEDAEQLEAAAIVDREAAASARAIAEDIRQERQATERALEVVDRMAALPDAATVLAQSRPATAAETSPQRRRAKPRKRKSKREH
jgi:hypothetical protein